MDTGASRSVFPHHSSAAPSGPRLLMADGNPVKAWGSRILPLQEIYTGSSYNFVLLESVLRPL